MGRSSATGGRRTAATSTPPIEHVSPIWSDGARTCSAIFPLGLSARRREAKEIFTEALAARDLPERKRTAVAEDLAARMEAFVAEPQAQEACRRLVKHLARESDALFNSLTADDIDATNGRAERGIRPAMVDRKVWGGNRSWARTETQGTITSVIRTAAQQGVDIIDYLTRRAGAPSTTPLFG